MNQEVESLAKDYTESEIWKDDAEKAAAFQAFMQGYNRGYLAGHRIGFGMRMQRAMDSSSVQSIIDEYSWLQTTKTYKIVRRIKRFRKGLILRKRLLGKLGRFLRCLWNPYVYDPEYFQYDWNMPQGMEREATLRDRIRWHLDDQEQS